MSPRVRLLSLALLSLTLLFLSATGIAAADRTDRPADAELLQRLHDERLRAEFDGSPTRATCTAECEGGGSVSCSGEICVAVDGEGCGIGAIDSDDIEIFTCDDAFAL